MSTDRDLDDIEGLDDVSALYRETRAVRIPDALDRRVLASARRELEAGRFRRPRHGRWMAPLALAATLVLGVGLVTVLQRTQPPADAVKPFESQLQTSAPAAPPGAEPMSEVPTVSPQNEFRSEQPALAPEPPRAQPQSAPALSGRRQREVEEQIAPGVLKPFQDAGSKLDAASSAPVRPPAAWLAEIIELRRQGRTTEADAALREFRLHYPDYPLDALREADTP